MSSGAPKVKFQGLVLGDKAYEQANLFPRAATACSPGRVKQPHGAPWTHLCLLWQPCVNLSHSVEAPRKWPDGLCLGEEEATMNHQDSLLCRVTRKTNAVSAKWGWLYCTPTSWESRTQKSNCTQSCLACLLTLWILFIRIKLTCNAFTSLPFQRYDCFKRFPVVLGYWEEWLSPLLPPHNKGRRIPS